MPMNRHYYYSDEWQMLDERLSSVIIYVLRNTYDALCKK